MRARAAAFSLLMRPGLPALAALIATLGCSGGAARAPSSGSAIADLDLPGERHAAPGAPAAGGPAAKASASAPGGLDFIDDARLLLGVAACGGAGAPLPPELGGGDAKAAAAIEQVVQRHCRWILDNVKKFRAAYFEKHRPWFEAVVPRDHRTVVYPFGGGDLLSALVAFPEATEITTISLEQAGDPRRLRKLAPWQVDVSLGALRAEIGGLISVGSNTSENLSKQQRNELPGQVSSFLLGLVAGGYEPVAMRYFTIEGTGDLRYIGRADLDALDARASKKLKHDWESPNFSEAFQNVEIQYRRPGEATLRVHRHVGWNLGDAYLKQNPQLLRHLEKKGKVVMLTKGASYLLWRADFSLIRKYMLDHLTWMLSDSTGIPPIYAAPAGMVQETYGWFGGAFLEGAQDNRSEASFLELWRRSPRRSLGFRFGYLDKDGTPHLVVTRPRT